LLGIELHFFAFQALTLVTILADPPWLFTTPSGSRKREKTDTEITAIFHASLLALFLALLRSETALPGEDEFDFFRTTRGLYEMPSSILQRI
jgi:hypothetical protein